MPFRFRSEVVAYNAVMAACEKGRDYPAARQILSEFDRWVRRRSTGQSWCLAYAKCHPIHPPFHRHRDDRIRKVDVCVAGMASWYEMWKFFEADGVWFGHVLHGTAIA